MSLIDKANEVYHDMLAPLVTAIRNDAIDKEGDIYSEEDIFKRAVALQLYALAKGKTIRIDLETRTVILE